MNTFFTRTENTRWMIVDDNADMLAMLASLMEKLTRAEIECYSSPESALAAFAAAPGKYELVITDFDMPDMDGMELCRRLREISPAQEIFLATGSDAFTEETAWHAGFNALLNKPFPLATLRDALAAAGLENETVCAN